MTSNRETPEDWREPGLGSRIRELIDLVGGPDAASQISGKSADQLRRYADLRSGVLLEPIARLAKAAGRSVDWVISGHVGGRNGGEAAGHPDYVALPRYDIRAAAGHGELVHGEQVVDWIYFKQEWLRRTLGVSAKHLAVIEAVGDSMAPKIKDGDLLVVDLSEPKLRGDGIYVIALEVGMDVLSVKRVAVRPRGGLVISSDNPVYEQREEIAPDELHTIRLVGRVVWIGGRA